MIRGHGGNINTNPLGPAPGLLDYPKENLTAVNAFPQVDSKDLLETFASHHKIRGYRCRTYQAGLPSHGSFCIVFFNLVLGLCYSFYVIRLKMCKSL